MTSITEPNVSSSAGVAASVVAASVVAASVVAAAGRGKDGDRANEEGTSQ
jgi:hypothetical protein